MNSETLGPGTFRKGEAIDRQTYKTRSAKNAGPIKKGFRRSIFNGYRAASACIRQLVNETKR